MFLLWASTLLLGIALFLFFDALSTWLTERRTSVHVDEELVDSFANFAGQPDRQVAKVFLKASKLDVDK